MRSIGLMITVAALLATAGAAQAAPTRYEAVGTTGPAIQPKVDEFAAALGPANAPGSAAADAGHRQITWETVAGEDDKVTYLQPDAFQGEGLYLFANKLGVSEHQSLPFLGKHFFSSINSSYESTFSPFSGEKLFAPIDGNVTGVVFLIPGSLNAGRVQGFGAVFSDVDTAGATRIQYFTADGTQLLDQAVPTGKFAFAGASFSEGAVVGVVRITTGNASLSTTVSDGAQSDLVAMDDFVYGEPTDGDTVKAASDNCPTLPNQDQVDTDHDGQGDVCDPDDDNDGVPDSSDRLPGNGNETVDTDGDGIGDNQDSDDDNDGLPDAFEIAVGTNPKSADTDGDGVPDLTDNCAFVKNPDQKNTGGKDPRQGDACDPVDKTRPVVSSLKLAAKRFVGARGTKVTYKLSEPALLTFSFKERVAGRKSGSRCVAGRAKGKRCTTYRSVKTKLTLIGKTGSNTGRLRYLDDGNSLEPGVYKLSVTALDAAGNKSSKAATTTFTVK